MSTGDTTRREVFEDVGRATHEDRYSIYNTSYEWPWFSHTGWVYDSLTLNMTRSTRYFEHPTKATWLNGLDIAGPADPRGDPETQHLLWCDDRKCATFLSWAEVQRWAGNPNIRT